MTKTCKRCGLEKPRAEFTSTAGKCKRCRADIANERYHALMPEQKRVRNSSPGMRAGKARYRATPEGRAVEAAQNKRYCRANREWRNFTRRLAVYGLTLDQYHAIAERQDFLCAVCHKAPLKKKRLSSDDGFVIDHNHVTGKVRGLLCDGCNTGIGHLGDSAYNTLNAHHYLVKRGAAAHAHV